MNKFICILICFIVVFSLCCGFSYSATEKEKAESYVDDGNKHYEKGNLAKAKAAYEKAVSIYPQEARAHFNLAIILAKQGDIDSAINEYKKVLDLCPQYAVGHNNLGNLYVQQGNTDLAILEYNQAIKAAPKSPYAYNNLGDVLFKQGRYKEAAKQFQEVVRLVPEEIYGYNNLGNAYYKIGRYDDAVTQYNHALDIEPRTVYLLTNKAQSYIRKGSYAFALSCLNQAKKYDPKNATVYNLLGDVDMLKGDRETAIKNYKKTISLKKDYAEAYYKLGKIYRYDSPDKSLDYFEKYLKYGTDPVRKAKTVRYIKWLEVKGKRTLNK